MLSKLDWTTLINIYTYRRGFSENSKNTTRVIQFLSAGIGWKKHNIYFTYYSIFINIIFILKKKYINSK